MEAKIIEKLSEIDIGRAEAKILFYLFKNNSGFARVIERDVDLRQPEVSAGTKSLLGRGWIKSKAIVANSRGRPQNKYSLAKSKNEIVKEINTFFTDKIHLLEEDIKLLNELKEV